jgi:serine/threonine protein kinase
MHARLVVHLDLKADNILIRPTTSGNASGVSLLLGDFGEAMVLGPGAAVMMKQSRGTECIQAPEMLMAGHFSDFPVNFLPLSACQRSRFAGSQHALSKHDRRKPVSASYSADVWSVGCLFYELLFGEFLFSDPEWTQFFVRVTKDILPIASDSAAAAMAPYPQVSAFLSYTLVRNPNMRPSISEVVSKFDAMFGRIMEQPFTASLPTRAPAFDSVAGASHWPVSIPTALERDHFFRSFVPIHLSGNWSGKLHIGCWPPPARTADLNLFVVVSSEPLSAQTCGCHHMCVGLKCLEEFAVSSSEHVAAFRAHLKPCLDALMMCLLQGGSCAICSEEGAGCCDVVVLAVSLLCLGGMSLLQALRLLRQAIVIHTPPPSALDLIHAAFQPA